MYTAIIQKIQLTVYQWMADVDRVLESHEDFARRIFSYVMVEYCNVSCGGCPDILPTLLMSTLLRKRCVICIRNTDDLCSARTVVVAEIRVDGPVVPEAVRRSDSTEQQKQAEVLQAAAG